MNLYDQLFGKAEKEACALRYPRHVGRFSKTIDHALTQQVDLPEIIDECSAERIRRRIEGRVLSRIRLPPPCQALYIECCRQVHLMHHMLIRGFDPSEPYVAMLARRADLVTLLFYACLCHSAHNKKNLTELFTLHKKPEVVLAPGWVLTFYRRGV